MIKHFWICWHLAFCGEVVSCRLLPFTVCCLLSVNCQLIQRWHHHINARICRHTLWKQSRIILISQISDDEIFQQQKIVLLITDWVVHPVGDNDDREQALVVQEPPLTYCHITRPPCTGTAQYTSRKSLVHPCTFHTGQYTVHFFISLSFNIFVHWPQQRRGMLGGIK